MACCTWRRAGCSALGRGLAGLLLALAAWAGAWAHAPEDGPPAAGHWSWQWTAEPWVLALLAASAIGYGLGLRRLWRAAGFGRGVPVRQAAAFALGWLTLVLAFVSPLDALGAQLFSAHMLQHELLMVASAPLLVLGRPLAVWLWALPPPQRLRVGRLTRVRWFQAGWRALSSPLGAWSAHALALWAWHMPALFDAALRSTAVHTLQHVSFLGTALLFWWSALAQHSPAGQGRALLYLFTTMVHSSALGALLTLSPHVWYSAYAVSAPALGIAPLEDQQLGGLLMWVPAGVAYLVTGLAVAWQWMGGGRVRPPPAAAGCGR